MPIRERLSKSARCLRNSAGEPDGEAWGWYSSPVSRAGRRLRAPDWFSLQRTDRRGDDFLRVERVLDTPAVDGRCGRIISEVSRFPRSQDFPIVLRCARP